MKKLLIIMLSLTMALGASAQHFYHSHVVVVGGYSPYYYNYGPFYPYYGYPYYPYPYYGYAYRPTKLDLKIEDIRNDYQEKIWAAKHDKSLPHKERRQQVRRLKHDRDEAIINARRNYYRR
jgi:hypothetical protein